MLVEAFSAVLCLEPLRHLGEQHHTADPQIPGPLDLTRELLEAPAIGTRHGTDGLHVGTFVHKQWIDEVGCLKDVFTHHGP